MNIAILIGHFPPGAFGGAELQAEAWAQRLAGRHRVTVITRRDPPTQPAHEQRDGYTVRRLSVSRIPLWRTVSDFRAIQVAVAVIRPRPDLLLCFQTFLSGLAGVTAGETLGIPALVWIRGEAEYRLDASRLNRALSPYVWHGAAGVLVQSEANRADLLAEVRARVPGLERTLRGKLEVVPNGLDLPDTTVPRGTRVLSVGRLIVDKGMDIVIDAAHAAGLPLTLAGEGPERARLEQRVRACGLDCRFEGFASRARLAELYRESACVVLAARRGEGLPNVLLEAMAHARPVVATACAGTRELLVPEGNGLLVPAGDAPALAAALRRLHDEPGLGDRLGAEARRTAARFAWDTVQPQLESVLEQYRR